MTEELMLTNPETGEELPSNPTLAATPDLIGFTERGLSEADTATLIAPFRDEEWDILPTGEVYVNHMRYRDRLTRVFGAGGWGMRPLEEMRFDADSGVAYQQWALYAHGVRIAEAVGSARYHEAADRRLDYADTAEAAKSNALTRCCKDLAMGADLYDRRKAAAWKAKHAIRVWVQQRDGKNKPQWRRLDADPFFREGDVTDDSPNQRPTAARHQVPATQEATTPAPTPAPTRTTETGERITAPVRIEDVREKKRGTSAYGKPYVITTITTVSGEAYDTFSESVADDAESACAIGVPVTLTLKESTGKNGKTYVHVTSVDLVEADGEPDESEDPRL